MKKIFGVLIFGLLLLQFFSLNGLNAQEETSGVGLGLNPEQLENADVEITTAWEYLGQEWKTILLGNPVVQGLDSFFQSINFVFFALFGTDYSMSLKLLLVIIVWIYCLVVLSGALNNFSIFSKGPSFVISLGLVIIMAHMKIIEAPVNFILWLFFAQKTWWMKLIIGVIILAILIGLAVILKKFGKQFKENRQKKKDEMNRMKLEQGAKIGDALGGVFKEK